MNGGGATGGGRIATGGGGLRTVLGGATITATSPTTVWIPAGVEHSANLRRGSGTFVVVYLREPQDSSGG